MTHDTKARQPRRNEDTGRLARLGKSILKRLAPGLQLRGIPNDAFIMVNISNDAFVNGVSRDQTLLRFEALHPGAEGWMGRFGDYIDEPIEHSADDAIVVESVPPVRAINRLRRR